MPDIYMDVDVALSEVPVNIVPLISDSDFKTRQTSVAFNAAGMDLVWNFVTPAGAFTQTAVTPTSSGTYDWAHQGDGMYTIEMPASGGASVNNDTEGFGWFTGIATGVLPWRGPVIGFRAAGLNDALIESTYSTTRGLAGTALPNAAAEASGGLPTLSAAQGSNGTINANVHRWLTGTPNALQSGRIDSYLGAVASGVIAAASFAANALDAVWSTATRLLTAGTNIVLAKGTGVTGFNDLSGADVRTAVGLASANLDTQLGGIDTVVDGIKDVTDNLPDSGALTSIASDAADAKTAAESADTKLGTPSDLGGGASIAQNLADIESQTDDIGAAGAGLSAVPWNAVWDEQVQSEVQDALEANHLDHLLAVGYDPQSKPGDAGALLNELVESDDASPSRARFTAEALEEAPTGGSAPTAGEIADAVWEEALADHEGTAGSTAEALADAGGSGASAADIADAVWDEALSGHTSNGTAGERLGRVPNAAAGGNGGLPTVDANNRVAGIQGTITTLDALDTAQDSQHSTTQSAIGALNDLSAADVNAEVDQALADYDPPTRTEATSDKNEILTRLGSPVGASVSADIADVEGKVDDLESRIGTPSNLGSGASVAANLVDIESQTDDIPSAATVAGAVRTELTTELGRLDAAVSTRATPTQVNEQADQALSDYDPPTKAELDAAQSAIEALINAMENLSASDVLTQVNSALETAVPDSVPADGSRPSIKQGIYLNTQFLLERSVSGTTLTVRKPDGSTALITLTLNDASAPTSITRTA